MLATMLPCSRTAGRLGFFLAFPQAEEFGGEGSQALVDLPQV
jgi:hypothetical protein